jgi:hypothetical protein
LLVSNTVFGNTNPFSVNTFLSAIAFILLIF